MYIRCILNQNVYVSTTMSHVHLRDLKREFREESRPGPAQRPYHAAWKVTLLLLLLKLIVVSIIGMNNSLCVCCGQTHDSPTFSRSEGPSIYIGILSIDKSLRTSDEYS
jgi:hypothetical protein